MSVIVLREGIYTTMQDAGRPGYRAAGIPLSGAMDELAFEAANALVGNGSREAALEFTMQGPELRFEEDTMAAICGGDFEIRLDGEPVPQWRCFRVRSGSVLRIGRAARGLRGYLAILGGFRGADFLGSMSTDARGGFGGRRIRTGDRIETNGCRVELPFEISPWFVGSELRSIDAERPLRIRCTGGPEAEWFDGRELDEFYEQAYKVTPQSDRMGIRLAGATLWIRDDRSMASEAAIPGTVQVPKGGEPIVLGCDAQTTGGYPRIAVVARADLPLLAQARPGDDVRFERVSVAEARELWFGRKRDLALLRHGVRLQLGCGMGKDERA